MEKKINDIITKYKEIQTIAWDNYLNVCRQARKEILDVIDFKGKYFKILENDKCVYFYITQQNYVHDFFVRLVGPGVIFRIDEDFNYRYGQFDKEFTYEINVCNMTSELKNIEEISRKEFITECSKHFDAARRSFTKLL